MRPVKRSGHMTRADAGNCTVARASPVEGNCCNSSPAQFFVGRSSWLCCTELHTTKRTRCCIQNASLHCKSMKKVSCRAPQRLIPLLPAPPSWAIHERRRTLFRVSLAELKAEDPAPELSPLPDVDDGKPDTPENPVPMEPPFLSVIVFMAFTTIFS